MQKQLSAAFSACIVCSHEGQTLTPPKSTKFLSLPVAGPSFLAVFITFFRCILTVYSLGYSVRHQPSRQLKCLWSSPWTANGCTSEGLGNLSFHSNTTVDDVDAEKDFCKVKGADDKLQAPACYLHCYALVPLTSSPTFSNKVLWYVQPLLQACRDDSDVLNLLQGTYLQSISNSDSPQQPDATGKNKPGGNIPCPQKLADKDAEQLPVV